MVCASCQRPISFGDVWSVRIDARNRYFRFCRSCTSGSVSVPDVYYGYGSGVQTEENIADPKTGKPIPFYDRTSKAAAMKMAGVQEAGDRVHGMRNESHLHRKTYFV